MLDQDSLVYPFQFQHMHTPECQILRSSCCRRIVNIPSTLHLLQKETPLFTALLDQTLQRVNPN